jgi:hypothetical protein
MPTAERPEVREKEVESERNFPQTEPAPAPLSLSRSGAGRLLWLVAYSALGLTALLGPANAEGVLGLVLAGHMLWAVAYLLGGAPAAQPDEGRAGKSYLRVVFGLIGVFELTGLAWGIAHHELFLVLWFALALSFLIPGFANAIRWSLSDEFLVCQLWFHFYMVVPLVLSLGSVLDGMPGAGGGADFFAVVALMIILIAGAAVPLFVVALSTAKVPGRRPSSRAWRVLMVHQVAFTVFAIRWMAARGN